MRLKMLELVYILQAFTSHVLNANKVVALLKKYYLCLNHLFKKNTLCKILCRMVLIVVL